MTLVLAVVGVAILIPVGNLVCWYFVARRNSPSEEYPWNWRVVIGPAAYYRWLTWDSKEGQS